MNLKSKKLKNPGNRFYKIVFCLVWLFLTNSFCLAKAGKKTSNKTPSSKPSHPTENNWLSTKTGRTKTLFATTNPEKLKQFVPSGLFQQEQILGNWKVVLHSALYFSNEENPDTSKDQPASAIVYSSPNPKTNRWTARFAGKGYQFSLIKNPNQKTLFILRYWTGTMGCSFIDLSFAPTIETKNQPKIEYRSTKTVTTNNPLGKLCQTDKPLLHWD